MPSDRPNQTLADYVAIAISPALIMGLVGSLVFFLQEILYSESGPYKAKLQWIFVLLRLRGRPRRAHVSDAKARQPGPGSIWPGAGRTYLDRHANLRRLSER